MIENTADLRDIDKRNDPRHKKILVHRERASVVKKVLLFCIVLFCFVSLPYSFATVYRANGFYPIWENTGYTVGSSSLLIGYSHLQYGFASSHIGLQPDYYFYRAPNLHYKHVLYSKPNRSFALQIGAMTFLRNSGESLSEFYTSRIDNPDFTLWMFPVSAAESWQVYDWFLLHQTITALPLFSTAKIKNNVSVGYSAVTEFLAGKKHSFLLHGGEIGFWSHDFWYTGFSYRYARQSFWIQAGYFYRFRQEGTQQSPMIELGVSI